MIFNFINLNVLEEGHLEILNELKNEKETRVLYLEAKYDKLRKQYHLEDRFNIRFRMDPCMPNGELLRRLRPGERDNVITRMQRWEDANRKKFSDLPREEWVHVFAHINHLSYPEVEHILNNLPKGE